MDQNEILPYTVMVYRLAKQLKDAGFPVITRWEIENNHRRTISATGQETLAPMGALLSEMKGAWMLAVEPNNEAEQS